MGIGNFFGSRNKRGRPLGEEFFAYLEKLGRAMNPSLANDVPGSIAARNLGLIEFFHQLREYEKSHPPILLVPDPGSLVEFLKNARKVYRGAHLTKNKRGPKPSDGDALSWIANLESKLKREPTREEIIERLTNKDTYRADTVSTRTAEKFVKLYSLIKSGKQRLTKKDAQWLRKNFGPKGLPPNWWTEKQYQWFLKCIDATGISKQIGDYWAMSSTALARERKKLEARRRRLTFQDKS